MFKVGDSPQPRNPNGAQLPLHEKPMPTIIFDGYDLSAEFEQYMLIEDNHLDMPTDILDPSFDSDSTTTTPDPEIPF